MSHATLSGRAHCEIIPTTGNLLAIVRAWGKEFPAANISGRSLVWFIENAPYRVERDRFPELPDGIPREYPCTDGCTIWLPRWKDLWLLDILFHEMSHAEMHYPNGPDLDLVDPFMREPMKSIMEAEACAAAMLTLHSLNISGQGYNAHLLSVWNGDVGEFEFSSAAKVRGAAEKLITHYVGKASAKTEIPVCDAHERHALDEVPRRLMCGLSEKVKDSV